MIDFLHTNGEKNLYRKGYGRPIDHRTNWVGRPNHHTHRLWTPQTYGMSPQLVRSPLYKVSA